MSLRSAAIHSWFISHKFIRTMAFILVVTTILGVVYVYRAPLHRAYGLATSHQPETYTELYFDNSPKLPMQVTAGKPYTYTVHIANHEAKPMTYRVIASVEVPNVAPVITTVTIRLSSGQATDKTFRLQLSQPHQSATIKVGLPSQQQYVTFRSQS